MLLLGGVLDIAPKPYIACAMLTLIKDFNFLPRSRITPKVDEGNLVSFLHWTPIFSS